MHLFNFLLPTPLPRQFYSKVDCIKGPSTLSVDFEALLTSLTFFAAGQYTNLKFQAASLGLGDRWERVKLSYAAANRALGDIVKVRTPTQALFGICINIKPED